MPSAAALATALSNCLVDIKIFVVEKNPLASFFQLDRKSVAALELETKADLIKTDLIAQIVDELSSPH